MKRLILASLGTLTLALSGLSGALASSSAPLTLVVPYAAGGNVDTTGRLIAPRLTELLGQTVVVENKPGAGGMIAAEYVVRSRPDGNTLFISSNGPVLHSPLIFDRPLYDWKKDFIPVSSVSFTPMVLLAAKGVPFNSLADLKEQAKASPGSFSIATPGMGSTNHLMAELLKEQLGLDLNTIHYKGTAPAANDLLGGHVTLSFDQINVALPHIQQGSVTALAVTVGERLPQLPDVPTFKELGVDIEAASFVGIFAPAGTPDARVTELAEAVSKVLAEDSAVQAFAKQGARAQALPPSEFRQYLHDEDKIWLPIIDRTIVQTRKK